MFKSSVVKQSFCAFDISLCSDQCFTTDSVSPDERKIETDSAVTQTRSVSLFLSFTETVTFLERTCSSVLRTIDSSSHHSNICMLSCNGISCSLSLHLRGWLSVCKGLITPSKLLAIVTVETKICYSASLLRSQSRAIISTPPTPTSFS